MAVVGQATGSPHRHQLDRHLMMLEDPRAEHACDSCHNSYLDSRKLHKLPVPLKGKHAQPPSLAGSWAGSNHYMATVSESIWTEPLIIQSVRLMNLGTEVKVREEYCSVTDSNWITLSICRACAARALITDSKVDHQFVRKFQIKRVMIA